MAPIVLAVEDRPRTGIVVIGGLETGWRSEVSNSSYIRRVKIPVLLLSGRYDMAFPFETSSRPMFDLLGTPGENKAHKIYETDHWIPHNELIKETLARLDKQSRPGEMKGRDRRQPIRWSAFSPSLFPHHPDCQVLRYWAGRGPRGNFSLAPPHRGARNVALITSSSCLTLRRAIVKRLDNSSD